MTGLEPILREITQNAEALALEIKTNAEKAAEKLRKDAFCESAQIRDEFEEKITAEIEEIHFSKNAEFCDMEKIAKLRAKKEAVEAVKKEAAKRVANLSDEEYCRFIKNLIKKAELWENSVVCLNERDKKRLSPKMFYPSEVCDGEIKTLAGFKVFGKNADFDFTIEAILEEKNNEICDAVNKIYQRENGQ